TGRADAAVHLRAASPPRPRADLRQPRNRLLGSTDAPLRTGRDHQNRVGKRLTLTRSARSAAASTTRRSRREAALLTSPVVLLHRALGHGERPRRVEVQQTLFARALGLTVAVRRRARALAGRGAGATFVALVGHQTFLT